MPTPVTTQPVSASEVTRAGWWAAFALAALKIAHKALDLWRFRTSVERRLERMMDEKIRHQGEDIERLNARIGRLEQEKTALQTQNGNQQGRIESLERELAQLRTELTAVTDERDALRADAVRRGGAK